jgi:YggT family protein
MTVPALAFAIASALVWAFLLLCVLRIFSAWFFTRCGGERMEKALSAATDWYFGLFHRLRFLRQKGVDFTPTFAAIVLIVPAAALGTLGASGAADLGALLGIILASLWAAFAFLLAILILLFVVRLIALQARAGVRAPFMAAVQAITEPVLYRVSRILFGKRIVSLRASLAAAALALAAIWAAGSFLCPLAVKALARLPF